MIVLNGYALIRREERKQEGLIMPDTLDQEMLMGTVINRSGNYTDDHGMMQVSVDINSKVCFKRSDSLGFVHPETKEWLLVVHQKHLIIEL